MVGIAHNPSRCIACGGRLRNSVFCSVCGESSCSWVCYVRHIEQHSARTDRLSSDEAAERDGVSRDDLSTTGEPAPQLELGAD